MKTKILLIFILAMPGCISRKEIEAALWLNNGLPAELCGPNKAESLHPEIWSYGFYRRLNNGKYEFVPFCSPHAREWVSMHKDDFKRILDSTVPEVPEP